MAGAGGRTDGQPFAFQLQKSAAERHFCAAAADDDDDEDERTSLSGFLPPLLRSKFGSRRSTLVRVNEVGRNADKFPLLPLIRGRTNRRSLGEKGSGKKDHPSGSERGSRAADLVSRENLVAWRRSSFSPSVSSSAIWLILCLRAPAVAAGRAAANSSGGGESKKKPGQPPLSGDWRQATGAGEKGHFGTGRIWAEKGFSLVLLLLAAFICHTSQSLPSLECGVARVDCGLQKTPEPDPNYKSCGR